MRETQEGTRQIDTIETGGNEGNTGGGTRPI